MGSGGNQSAEKRLKRGFGTLAFSKTKAIFLSEQKGRLDRRIELGEVTLQRLRRGQEDKTTN